MAIVNARNLVDSETRTVRMFEINNATNSNVVVVDASALRGHSSCLTQVQMTTQYQYMVVVSMDFMVSNH